MRCRITLTSVRVRKLTLGVQIHFFAEQGTVKSVVTKLPNRRVIVSPQTSICTDSRGSGGAGRLGRSDHVAILTE